MNILNYNIHQLSILDKLYKPLESSDKLNRSFYFQAHLFTSASKIFGIELNTELCSLQNSIIQKYALDDRIQIMNENMLDCSDIVSKGEKHIIFRIHISNTIMPILNHPYHYPYL